VEAFYLEETMGRMKQYLDLIQQSRLLAPNLKEMTLKLYTGNQHKGNVIARCVYREGMGLDDGAVVEW
jgi:hypothetical protein